MASSSDDLRHSDDLENEMHTFHTADSYPHGHSRNDSDGVNYYLRMPQSFAQRVINLPRAIMDPHWRDSLRSGFYAPLSSGNGKDDALRTRGKMHLELVRFARWTAILLPVLILMIFGILHIVQVLLGRASLFWDGEHDDFLPNWGSPGGDGQYVAHYPTDATRDVIPLACHSHNDYWRRIPFWEAIHYGCTGVEADVWLFDDELFVGHNLASLTKNRTFRSLYVDPIMELLDQQNPSNSFSNTTDHGIFDTDPGQTLVLLVDFKTDAYKTWPAVRSQLSGLRDKGYLTHYNGEKVVQRQVTVVGTGNCPFDMVTHNTTYRDIFFDAPLDRLWEGAQPPKGPKTELKGERAAGQGGTGIGEASPDDFNPSTSYYASVSFNHAVGKVWNGHLSPRQMDILRGQIRGARRRGLKSRYWDTPAWPISTRNHVWHVLMKEGAEMLNVDDLRSAARLDWRKWRHEWW